MQWAGYKGRPFISKLLIALRTSFDIYDLCCILVRMLLQDWRRTVYWLLVLAGTRAQQEDCKYTCHTWGGCQVRY